MARTGSTRRTTKMATDETPVENVTAETTEATPVPVSTEAEEAPTVSDTIEAEAAADAIVDEAATAASETTTTPEENEKAKAAALAEQHLTEFQAAVENALANHDESTGTVPEVNLEAVKTAARELSGAKYRKKADDFLNEKLKDLVGNHDIVGATALMACIEAKKAAGSSKSTSGTGAAPKSPADPAAEYRQRLAAIHLAYNLVREDVPVGVEGFDADAERAKVDEEVGGLLDQAASYYAWVKSTAEDKGDEPEVSAEVKRAVKLALGKGVGAGRPRAASTGERAPRTGANRNVLTHIQQAFEGVPSGTSKRIAEIAKAKTAEYPDGDCSPGAISARFKGDKTVDGFKMQADSQGVNVVTKL